MKPIETILGKNIQEQDAPSTDTAGADCIRPSNTNPRARVPRPYESKMNPTVRSAQCSQRLAELTPGGVNSTFRSFVEVGGYTIFFSHASGSKVFDLDDNTYIDYLCGWGPAVLGHCHPEVVAAWQKAIGHGPVFGAPHLLEIEFAEALIKAVPSLEQVRFVNSGTEAVMSAIRLARGATGKDKIIIFAGSYHGHSDSVLASRTPAASTGITASNAEDTLIVEYNDLNTLQQCLQIYKDQVAAVLMEPVAGSSGVIPPEPGYLQGIRELCGAYDALLIFDEVLTGFRVAYGGAQGLYGIHPDLTCFGKALGGGMPIGAYGGSKELMSHLMPSGKVYQAGTFSGNPVTMAGGIATLQLLSNPAVFQTLENLSEHFFAGLQTEIDHLHIPVQLQRVGSMFAIIFSPHAVNNYQDSLKIDNKQYAQFFHYLLERGIYMPPSAVDAACLSSSHSLAEIDYTISICTEAFAKIFNK